MEALTGSWRLQAVVTSVNGDSCLQPPCPADVPDCHGCCRFDFELPTDVSGFFVNQTKYGDSWYNGHPLEVTSSTISPPDCTFYWYHSVTQPRAGGWVSSMQLIQRSPTELDGTGTYNANGVFGVFGCEVSLSLLRNGVENPSLSRAVKRPVGRRDNLLSICSDLTAQAGYLDGRNGTDSEVEWARRTAWLPGLPRTSGAPQGGAALPPRRSRPRP